MAFKDSFFKRIKEKTNVDKETILSLASKLQKNDMKNEGTLREVIKELSNITGKDVSEDSIKKIIKTVQNDNVPKDIDKML